MLKVLVLGEEDHLNGIVIVKLVRPLDQEPMVHLQERNLPLL